MTPAELRALLADSLALWGIAGRVEVLADGVAVIAPGAGRCVVRPADPALRPVRWFVEMPAAVAAGRGPRAAASIVGVLGAVRSVVEA